MIKAIIIDDEINGIKSLELLIRKFVPEIQLLAQTTDPLEGVKLINQLQPDVVFLDINMPALNGFELLNELDYRKFHLIFTTAHQEYAIRAIRESAIDYLLKPIDIDDLHLSVARVKEHMKVNPTNQDIQQILGKIIGIKNIRIPLPSRSGIEYVSPSMIIYVEANSNVSKVVLTNLSVLEVTKPLKDYESLLCQEGLYFMRVHNSYIINLNYVSRYLREEGGYAVMQGNTKIPISKQKKAEFLEAFNLDS